MWSCGAAELRSCGSSQVSCWRCIGSTMEAWWHWTWRATLSRAAPHLAARAAQSSGCPGCWSGCRRCRAPQGWRAHGTPSACAAQHLRFTVRVSICCFICSNLCSCRGTTQGLSCRPRHTTPRHATLQRDGHKSSQGPSCRQAGRPAAGAAPEQAALLQCGRPGVDVVLAGGCRARVVGHMAL
jgi:hypothetical protein